MIEDFNLYLDPECTMEDRLEEQMKEFMLYLGNENI